MDALFAFFLDLKYAIFSSGVLSVASCILLTGPYVPAGLPALLFVMFSLVLGLKSIFLGVGNKGSTT